MAVDEDVLLGEVGPPGCCKVTPERFNPNLGGPPGAPILPGWGWVAGLNGDWPGVGAKGESTSSKGEAPKSSKGDASKGEGPEGIDDEEADKGEGLVGVPKEPEEFNVF